MENETRSYSYRGPVSAASPAGRAMGEALDLAMDGKSPYPDKSTFIDADTPHTDREVKAAAADGQSAIVVSANGGTRILSPEEISGSGAADAA